MRHGMKFASFSPICLGGFILSMSVAMSTASHGQVAALDVMQQAQAAASRIDADIRAAETRIARLTAGLSGWQADAKKINAAAAAYRHSAKVAREKKDYDDYQTACAGKALSGAQFNSCMTRRDKLAGVVARHNRTITAFKAKAAAANRKVQAAKIDIARAPASIENLQSYRSWLIDAVVKIGEDVEQRCGAVPSSNELPDDIKRRCGSIPFDSARIDVPPCKAGSCDIWDKYFRR